MYTKKTNKKTIAIFLLFIVIFSLLSYHFLLSPKENSFFNNSNNKKGKRKPKPPRKIKSKKNVLSKKIIFFLLAIVFIVIIVVKCCCNKKDAFNFTDNFCPGIFEIDFDAIKEDTEKNPEYCLKNVKKSDMQTFNECIAALIIGKENDCKILRVDGCQKNFDYIKDETEKDFRVSFSHILSTINTFAYINTENKTYKRFSSQKDFFSILFSGILVNFFEFVSADIKVEVEETKGDFKGYFKLKSSEGKKNKKITLSYDFIFNALKKVKEEKKSQLKNLTIIKNLTIK